MYVAIKSQKKESCFIIIIKSLLKHFLDVVTLKTVGLRVNVKLKVLTDWCLARNCQ